MPPRASIRLFCFLTLITSCALRSNAQSVPSVSSVSPPLGPVGTVLTLAGQNFGATQGTSTVTFGTILASPTSWSNTQIVVPVPSALQNGTTYIYVTTSVGTSAATYFLVGQNPLLSTISPQLGPAGTAVTLAGQRFGATQGSSTVTFGSVAASPTSWSDTQIVVPVPNAAPNGGTYIYVNTAAGSSNAQYFAVGALPTINSVSPPLGPPGTVVTLAGTRFGATQGNSTVQLGSVVATPTSWSDTQIVVPVPSAAPNGANYISVTTSVGTGNSAYFLVGQNPLLSSIGPQQGSTGTPITLSGLRFGPTRGSSTVTFGGATSTPTSWSDTQIVAPVPAGISGAAFIYVTTTNGSSNPQYFNATNPSLTSLSPTSGPIGATVTISGTNFGSTQGSSTVKFNGTTANVTGPGWGSSSITVSVPNGATTGNVVVTVGGIASNGVTFTVTSSIASLSPSLGRVGQGISIIGSNFGTTQGSSTVTFNGIAATPTSWSPTIIFTPVPAGASTGNVVVTVSGVQSNGVPFAVTPVPIISSLSPSSGTFGSSVTVTGSNFGASPGAGTITFNGTIAVPTTWNNTSIVVNVPYGATTGGVVVNAGGQTSTPLNFTVSVPTPNIAGVSPTAGPVGGLATITGTNFGPVQGTSTVAFNGVVGIPTSWSNTQIVAQVPTGATTGNVAVSVAGSTSNGVLFSVSTLPPTISSISPDAGGPGTLVTISGTYFGPSQGSSTVTFGTVHVTPISWSDTSLTIQVPSGLSTGTLSVLANIAGVNSNAVQFNVTQPLRLNPASLTLFLGSSSPLQFTDENGVPLTGVTFSVVNTAIAEIDLPANQGDPTLVRALAVGTTQVVAAVGGRSGQAQITVVNSGGSLPTGSIAWTASSLSGGPLGYPFVAIHSVQTGSSNAPALYLEDYFAYGINANGTNGSSIQAFTENGQRMWNWPAGPSVTSPVTVAADNQGGILYWANPNASGKYLGRLDPSGNETWQHPINFQSNLSPALLNSVAVHPDGTIFYSNFYDWSVNALDPTTGQTKFTIPLLNQSQSQQTNLNYSSTRICSPGSLRVLPISNFVAGSLSIDALGNVYIPFSNSSETFDAEPCNTGATVNTQTATWSTQTVLSLATIHSDGSYSFQTLDTINRNGTDWSHVIFDDSASDRRAIPDGQGGVIVPFENFLYHVANGTTQKINSPVWITSSLPTNDNLLVGANGLAYLYGSTNSGWQPTLAAVDFTTGATKWILPLPVSSNPQLVAVLNNGSLILTSGYQGSGTWSVDLTGQLSPFLGTGPAASSDAAIYLAGGFWGTFLADGTFASVSGPQIDPADAFSQSVGAAERQAREPHGAKFNSDPNSANAISSACSGLDDTEHIYPRWLLVPVGGNNTVRVSLNHGWHNVSLQSADATIATVSPANATDGTIVTVTGQKVGVVNIQATNSDDSEAAPVALTVTVKPQLPKSLDIVKVIDNVKNLSPQNMPDQAALTTYINKVWIKQANVTFSPVNRHTDLTVHWDLLPAPNGNNVMDDWSTYGNQLGDQTEASAIILAMPDIDGHFDHKYAFYINQFGPEKGCPTCTLLGLSYVTQAQPGQPFTGQATFVTGTLVQEATRDSVTAHELGHLLGAPDVKTGPYTNDLMWFQNSGGAACKVRKRDWELINPTPGDGN